MTWARAGVESTAGDQVGISKICGEGVPLWRPSEIRFSHERGFFRVRGAFAYSLWAHEVRKESVRMGRWTGCQPAIVMPVDSAEAGDTGPHDFRRASRKAETTGGDAAGTLEQAGGISTGRPDGDDSETLAGGKDRRAESASELQHKPSGGGAPP